MEALPCSPIPPPASTEDLPVDEPPRAKVVTRVSLKRPFPMLLKETADAFGITPEDILQRDRHKTVTAARHVCAWVARELWAFSFPELGRLFGNRDHTTMMAAVRRVDHEIAKGSRIGERAIELRDLGKPDEEETPKP